MKLDVKGNGTEQYYGAARLNGDEIRTTHINNTTYYSFSDAISHLKLTQQQVKALLPQIQNQCKVVKMINSHGNPSPTKAITKTGMDMLINFSNGNKEDNVQAEEIAAEDKTSGLLVTPREKKDEKINDPVDKTTSIFDQLDLLDVALTKKQDSSSLIMEHKDAKTKLKFIFIPEEGWYIAAFNVCSIIHTTGSNDALKDELSRIQNELTKPLNLLPVRLLKIHKTSKISKLRMVAHNDFWWVSLQDICERLEKYPNYPLNEELQAEILDWTASCYRNQDTIDALRHSCYHFLEVQEAAQRSADFFDNYFKMLKQQCSQ